MKILVLLLLSSVLLFSCAKPKPQIIYTTVEVEVPVYQIPKFNIPPKPILPTQFLTEDDRSDHNTIGKAYVAAKRILEGYADELYNLLEGIQEKSPTE